MLGATDIYQCPSSRLAQWQSVIRIEDDLDKSLNSRGPRGILPQ
jgi:hypothetical protein